jgi:hypothetical protein
MKLPSEELTDALSLTDQGEGQGVGLRTAAGHTNALAQKDNLSAHHLSRAACTLTRHATCWRKSRDDLSRLAAADTSAAAGEVLFRKSPGHGQGIQNTHKN